MDKKYLNSPLELKTCFDSGLITGYASVFEMIDFHNDMLAPGAFKKSINTKLKHDIKFLWQHKIDEPIGVISHLEEDDYGLYVEAKLIFKIAKAFEAYSLIETGAVRGLSIGYYPIEYYYEKQNNIRIITEVELKEISLVTFPANQSALIGSYSKLN